jgi:hypothetical protein
VKVTSLLGDCAMHFTDISEMLVHVVHVNGVRRCLLTVSTNGPIILIQMIYKYGEPRWNEIDKEKPKYSEKILS